MEWYDRSISDYFPTKPFSLHLWTNHFAPPIDKLGEFFIVDINCINITLNYQISVLHDQQIFDKQLSDRSSR